MNHNESIRTITPPCVARDTCVSGYLGKIRGSQPRAGAFIPPPPLASYVCATLGPPGGSVPESV